MKELKCVLILFALCLSVATATEKPVNIRLILHPGADQELAFTPDSRDASMRVDGSTSLKRQWVSIHDEFAPAFLTELKVLPAGALSGASHMAQGKVNIKTGLSGFEVRLVFLDVWGQPIRTVASSFISDFRPRYSYSFEQLGLFQNIPPLERPYFTCLAYISRARLANGQIWRINENEMLQSLLAEGFFLKEHDFLTAEEKDPRNSPLANMH